jgi:hypothetical protein
MIVILSEFLWPFLIHLANLHTNSGFATLLISIVASLVFVGWITTIVGGMAGALLICLQRALTLEIEPQSKDML